MMMMMMKMMMMMMKMMMMMMKMMMMMMKMMMMRIIIIIIQLRYGILMNKTQKLTKEQHQQNGVLEGKIDYCYGRSEGAIKRMT